LNSHEFVNLVSDFVCDRCDKVLHFVVCLVVTGNNPDQSQSIHQRRKGFLYTGEVFAVDILELALQGLEEFHVVLGFTGEAAKLLHLFFKVNQHILVVKEKN
jgi:hypothetical protein